MPLAAAAALQDLCAVILAHEGQYDGPTPPLTGAEALDLADLAAIASALLQHPVPRQVIGDEDLRAKMVARGAPSPAVDIALGLYAASRNGEFSQVDPTLGRLLGRNPTTVRDLLAAAIRG